MATAVVSVVTAAAVDPVTLAEAKAHLGVAHTSDDARITRLIRSATQLCQHLGNQVAIRTTYDYTIDAFPGASRDLGWVLRWATHGSSAYGGLDAVQIDPSIILPRHPLVSVTSITYLDADGASQTLSTSVYAVLTGHPGRVALKSGQAWPATRDQAGAITIRFVAGHAAAADGVPNAMKDAILLTIQDMYDRRLDAGDTATLSRAAAALLAIDDARGGYS